jgi:hypothetical protein
VQHFISLIFSDLQLHFSNWLRLFLLSLKFILLQG